MKRTLAAVAAIGCASVAVADFKFAATPDFYYDRVRVDLPVFSNAQVTAVATWAGTGVATGVQAKVGRPVYVKLPHPFHAWSPKTPQLYGVTVSVTTADGRTETAKAAFGMRTVGFRRESDGLEHLALNDHAVQLKPGADGWVRAEGLRDAAFYDACDRRGTLVVQALPDDEAAAKGIFDAVRNHPSVICWEVISTFSPASRALRKWDVTRPLIRPGDTRLALAPPPRIASEPVVVAKSGEDGIAYYRCPALVTAPNGDLVAAMDVRKKGINDMHYGMPMWVSVKRSTDGGRTWTKAEKAWDWPWTDAERRSATDPSLVVDGKAGKIFLFYTGREFVKGDAPNEFFVQESSDNGRTWTKPRELTKEIAIPAWPFGGDDRKNKANIFIPSGSGTQLKDGTLVHTITWASKGEIALLASRDHGKSWFIMGKPVRAGNECKVVELADGSLMVNSRYYAAKRYVVESKDRGETWTCRWDAALVDPMCNAQLMRVGRHLVFSNCRSIFRRNLFVRASADEGRTWNEGVCISPDGAGYSDITVLPNGDLGVLYEGVDYATIEFVTLPMKAVCGEDPEALGRAAKEDAAAVIPKGALWSREAIMFQHPPTLGFPPVFRYTSGKFRYTVTAPGVTNVFLGKTTHEPLTNVWDKLPVGWVTVKCEAEDARSHKVVTLPIGERTFWKAEPYDSRAATGAPRSFRQAAELAAGYVFAEPYVRKLAETGVPDPTYGLAVYPTKMLSSVIEAAVKAGNLDLARRAADYLVSISPPKGAPLAFWPPTYYFPKGYAGGGAAATGNEHRNMAVYPVSALSAYLDLYEATKEPKWRELAKNLGDSFLSRRNRDGTWYLVYDIRTGEPLERNRLVAVHAERAYARLAAATGDARYRTVADELWQDMLEGRLREWDWEGQFEDQEITPKYYNLTHVDVHAAIGGVLARDDKGTARDLLRFVEDQFVCWQMPFYPHLKLWPQQWKWVDRDRMWHAPRPGSWWEFPCALEQYNYYVPVDASAACVIRSFLALYRATGNPLDLAKAKALGAALVRRQCADGFIPTAWNESPRNLADDCEKCRKSYWINCLLHDATVLFELAETR